MIPIQDVTDADVAFPARVAHLMPAYADIPKEFKVDSTKWNQLVTDWFFSGLTNLALTPKDGVDKTKALRHLKCILGSFEPKHEHKEAAVAYLLSEWFSDATWEKARA